MNTEVDFAPIALFVYNRPEHTRLTIEALTRNFQASHSCLFIFSDGFKDNSDRESVNAVRRYLSQVQGFAKVTIIERNSNWGLANSIIEGVTHLCEQYGRVIVLEDDLQTSSYFLEYMNNALDLFKDDNRVASVSGYMFPIKHDFSNKIFLRRTPLSWGWATWKDSWDGFEKDGNLLLNNLKKQKKALKFNYLGPQPFFKMLKQQIKGKNNSWFIRWCASLFLTDKVTVMPTQSLVKNIGIDGTGTHCADWRFNPYDVKLSNSPILIEELDEIQTTKIERSLLYYFFKVRVLRYINFLYRLFRR